MRKEAMKMNPQSYFNIGEFHKLDKHFVKQANSTTQKQTTDQDEECIPAETEEFVHQIADEYRS